jgi:hypothetical protein
MIYLYTRYRTSDRRGQSFAISTTTLLYSLYGASGTLAAESG